MHSPLLKPACTPADGSDPVVFDFNLEGAGGKEHEPYFTTSAPTAVSSTVTNSLSSMLVSGLERVGLCVFAEGLVRAKPD